MAPGSAIGPPAWSRPSCAKPFIMQEAENPKWNHTGRSSQFSIRSKELQWIKSGNLPVHPQKEMHLKSRASRSGGRAGRPKWGKRRMLTIRSTDAVISSMYLQFRMRKKILSSLQVNFPRENGAFLPGHKIIRYRINSSRDMDEGTGPISQHDLNSFKHP